MKIIALEEHTVPSFISKAWTMSALQQDITVSVNTDRYAEQLEDLDRLRFAAMQDSGVDMQVLSLPPPGLHNFEASEAVPLAADFNDLLAATVARYPDKLEGFATLPSPDPEASARELERAVSRLGLKGALMSGRVRDRNMDDRQFDPIYEAASHLRVPLYIHPQLPRQEVRDAYYGGFTPTADLMFAMAALGWHYETGIQLLRMVMAGVFDRYPELQVITGHWGEVILFYLDRIALLDKADLKLKRPIRDYFRENVFYTPSGIFSQTYLNRTIEIVGAQRIMFSQDYPYQSAGNGGARAFLENAPISQAEKELIAHGNWEALSSVKPAQ